VADAEHYGKCGPFNFLQLEFFGCFDFQVFEHFVEDLFDADGFLEVGGTDHSSSNFYVISNYLFFYHFELIPLIQI